MRRHWVRSCLHTSCCYLNKIYFAFFIFIRNFMLYIFFSLRIRCLLLSSSRCYCCCVWFCTFWHFIWAPRVWLCENISVNKDNMTVSQEHQWHCILTTNAIIWFHPIEMPKKISEEKSRVPTIYLNWRSFLCGRFFQFLLH